MGLLGKGEKKHVLYKQHDILAQHGAVLKSHPSVAILNVHPHLSLDAASIYVIKTVLSCLEKWKNIKSDYSSYLHTLKLKSGSVMRAFLH